MVYVHPRKQTLYCGLVRTVCNPSVHTLRHETLFFGVMVHILEFSSLINNMCLFVVCDVSVRALYVDYGS